MTRSDYETFIRVFNEICAKREEICKDTTSCETCPFNSYDIECLMFVPLHAENLAFMQVFNKASNIIFAEQENRR